MTCSEEIVAKNALKRICMALIAFAVATVSSFAFVQNHPPAGWRSIIVLLPMVPLIFMVKTFLDFVRCMDEFKQRVYMESIAFSALATAVLTFGYGFLERVGWPALN